MLTFAEIVERESGNIVIYNSGGSAIETIAVTDSKITGTGTTQITINPAANLAPSTSYYLNVAATAFDDVAGNSYAGITDATTLNFTTPADTAAPTLSSSSPADGAISVGINDNIVLNFDEIVDRESGNLVIYNSSGSVIETIAVTDSKITGTGTTQITINPAATLSTDTGYYLHIAATAFDDVHSNSYAGISNATTLNFTTIDTINPTLSSSSPADNATGVEIFANIVLNFSEVVDRESGNITLKKTSDNSTIETIAVTDSKITGTGTTQITINPSTRLAGNTSYYLHIAATAFDDITGNSYAGISNATTLNFTTTANPCTVNGAQENGAISLANLNTAIATGTDDVTGCNTSSITNMSNLFKDKTSFNQDIGVLEYQ